MSALDEALATGRRLLEALAAETRGLTAAAPADATLVAAKRLAVDAWLHAAATLAAEDRRDPDLAALGRDIATAATANGRALRLRIEVAEALLAGLAEETRLAAGPRLVTYDGVGAPRPAGSRPPLARDARA